MIWRALAGLLLIQAFAAVPLADWLVSWFGYLLPEGQLSSWISVLDRWLLAGDPAGTAEAFGQMFMSALGPNGDGWPRLALVLLITVAGTGARELIRRKAQAEAADSAA